MKTLVRRCERCSIEAVKTEVACWVCGGLMPLVETSLPAIGNYTFQGDDLPEADCE